MRKFLVGLFVAAWMSSVAYAGCKTTQATVGFTTVEAFLAVDKVAGVSQAQAWNMMKQYAMDGKAIVIPEGSAITSIERINDYIAAIEINGVIMIILADHVRCR